jgi:hypothetical protein
MDPVIARRLWRVAEPCHAVVYFSPPGMEAFAAIGCKGFWMSYFGSRAAPMGAVSAEVVQATFYNFAPARVHRAVPDVWSAAGVDALVTTRLEVANEALRRLAPTTTSDEGAVKEAADLLGEVSEASSMSGRPLYGGHRSLPWPESPLLALWHGTSLLREHRGDGHIAALTMADLDGCEALVTHAAGGGPSAEILRQSRGWTTEEWASAQARLTERGWMNADGTFNADGSRARDAVEERTNELALTPLEKIGETKATRLTELLRPIAREIVASGGLPTVNPIGTEPIDE